MRNIQRFSNFMENLKNPFKRETRDEKWKKFLEEYDLFITDLDGKKIDIGKDNTYEFKVYYDPKEKSGPYGKKLLVGVVRLVMDNYYRIDNLCLYYYVYKSVSDTRVLKGNLPSIKTRWFDEPRFGSEEELANAEERPMGRVKFNANPSKTYNEQRIQLLMNLLHAWEGTTFPGYELYSRGFRVQNN